MTGLILVGVDPLRGARHPPRPSADRRLSRAGHGRGHVPASPFSGAPGGRWPITACCWRSRKVLPSYWLVQAGKTAIGGHGWPAEGWIVVGVWALVLIGWPCSRTGGTPACVILYGLPGSVDSDLDPGPDRRVDPAGPPTRRGWRQRRWARGWRSVVFPGVFLVYLIQSAERSPRTPRVGLIIGYVVLGVFCVCTSARCPHMGWPARRPSGVVFAVGVACSPSCCRSPGPTRSSCASSWSFCSVGAPRRALPPSWPG